MTFKDIQLENKEVFISMTNKFLDTLYNTDKNDPSAPMYEKLRRALIDGEELSLTQKHLILLLTTFFLNKSKQMIDIHTKAVEDFSIIESNLQKILKQNI